MEWLAAHATLLWIAGVFSVVTFVGTIVAIPLIVIALPRDYFIRENKPLREYSTWGKMGVLSLCLFQNVLGAMLLVAGVVMLVTPGQGVITMLIGISLMSIPWKKPLLLWVVRKGKVLSWINRFRAKHGKPPLDLPMV